MLSANCFVGNSETSVTAEIVDLQQSMSSLEIDMKGNENGVISSPTSPSSSSSSTSTIVTRRFSSRISNQSSLNLHKTNRRVISRPKKNSNTSHTHSAMTEAEIFKFYLNQKIKLKSTLLETIYEYDNEENDEICGEDRTCTLQFIGKKKLKRCLPFPVASHPTKTLVQKRRKRIQAVLGGKRKIKKISMETFLKKLKSIQDPVGDTCGRGQDNMNSAIY